MLAVVCLLILNKSLLPVPEIFLNFHVSTVAKNVSPKGWEDEEYPVGRNQQTLPPDPI